MFPLQKSSDFPGGPIVENPLANAGGTGPGRSLVREDPACLGQLSPCAPTWKPALWSPEPQPLEAVCLEPALCNKRRTAEPIRSNEDPAQPNKFKMEKNHLPYKVVVKIRNMYTKHSAQTLDISRVKVNDLFKVSTSSGYIIGPKKKKLLPFQEPG